MRLSVAVLIVAAAVVLGGGALIGVPALGACMIFEGLCAGAWALLRDDGTGVAEVPQVGQVGQTLQQIFDRARAS